MTRRHFVTEFCLVIGRRGGFTGRPFHGDRPKAEFGRILRDRSTSTIQFGVKLYDSNGVNG
jgi:hypothetical protein